MKAKNILYIVGGIAALALVNGIIQSGQQSAVPEPQNTEVPAQQGDPTMACSGVGAFAITKQLVMAAINDRSITIPSYEDSFVQHDPSGDLYEVRSYYFSEGQEVEFYASLRCSGSHWAADALTVNGQRFSVPSN